MTCAACKHEHADRRLAGICIGCPCEHVVADELDDVYAGADVPLCATCGVAWPCLTVRGEQ